LICKFHLLLYVDKIVYTESVI